MRKVLCFFLFIAAFSCRDKVTETVALDASGWAVKPGSLPKLQNPNPKADTILKDWPEFMSFKSGFEKIYNTDYREDFVLAIDDLVERQKKWEAGEYPEKFDNPQVRGRQKILKTFILKTKGDLIYRQNPETSIKQMIKAYNALIGQFNVTVNHITPKELLTDEN